MTTRLRYMGWIGVAVVVLLSAGATQAEKLGEIPEVHWTLGAPADFKDASAMVVFDRCSLIVQLDGIEVIRHTRMKVLTKSGIDRVADVELSFDKDDKIKDLQASTTAPDGTRTKVEGKAMLVKTAGDKRITTFAFPHVDSGCIVEYRYRDLHSRFFLLDPWFFTNDMYTLESQFTLVLYPGFTYSSAYTNMTLRESQPVVAESKSPNNFNTTLKSYTWTKRNIPPISDEPYMGAAANALSALFYQLVSFEDPYNKLTFIKDWTTAGEGYQKYLDEYMRGGDTKKTAATTAGDATTQQEKARRLYQYVTAGIQAKDDPEGSFLTNKSFGELVKAQSGTAEEKNLYLCQLCRDAGLQAWPVLIATRNVRQFNPEIYQISQFNYLITFVQFDSGFVFMDAANRYTPYGMLPPNSRAELGFLVDGKQSEIIRIALPEVRSYRLDATTVDVTADGTARCSTLCQFTGLFAPQWGQYFDEEKPEDIVKDDFIAKIDEAAVVDTFYYFMDSTAKFNLVMIYTSSNLARALDNNLAVKNVAYRFRENPFTATRRSFMVDFDFPFTVHSIMTLRADQPIGLPTLPAAVKTEMVGGTYSRYCQFRDNIITVDSKIVITQPMYPPSLYKDLQGFFESVAKAQQDEVILTWQSN